MPEIFSSPPTQAQPRASSRQKRFERRTDAPPLDLTRSHRYFQILYWLLKLRFMSTEQLARLLYSAGSLKYAERQLRRMYDAGYIDRFPVPAFELWGRNRGSYGAARAIHCLDEAGARFLSEQFGVTRQEVDWRPRHNHQPGMLDHTLATNDTLITAMVAAKRQDWQLEVIQSEREINHKRGHDRVVDPLTGKRVTVKADAVCRLALPAGEGIYFSLELDRGTEGMKKIKAKARAHAAHYKSGLYQKRFGTTSNRILFVVADVRDPVRAQPTNEAEWCERLAERAASIKQWIEAAVDARDQRLFWIADRRQLTPTTFFQGRVWLRPGRAEPQPLLGDG